MLAPARHTGTSAPQHGPALTGHHRRAITGLRTSRLHDLPIITDPLPRTTLTCTCSKSPIVRGKWPTDCHPFCHPRLWVPPKGPVPPTIQYLPTHFSSINHTTAGDLYGSGRGWTAHGSLRGRHRHPFSADSSAHRVGHPLVISGASHQGRRGTGAQARARDVLRASPCTVTQRTAPRAACGWQGNRCRANSAQAERQWQRLLERQSAELRVWAGW